MRDTVDGQRRFTIAASTVAVLERGGYIQLGEPHDVCREYPFGRSIEREATLTDAGREALSG